MRPVSYTHLYDWENATAEENDSAQNRMNSGKQLMTDMYVSSFEDMLYQLTGFNGGVKFVGYPSEDGTSNHAFQFDGAIAISSTCADKNLQGLCDTLSDTENAIFVMTSGVEESYGNLRRCV